VTHAEFVEHYRAGAIRVHIDASAAARYMSARLLLPFFMLPILGAGVALALIGWMWTGVAIIAAATIAPMLIKRSAPHFVLTQALHDREFYDDVVESKVLEIVESQKSDL
jgi:hypothetical protein